MRRLILALGLMVATTGVVRAQNVVQPGDAPATPTIPPPIVAPPPARLQYQPREEIAPLPPLRFDRELAARGHKKKMLGGVLMGVGSAALLTGGILIAYAVATPRSTARPQPYFCMSESRCPSSGVSTSYDLGTLVSGALLSLAGSTMLYAGIPIYVVGGAQVRKAERVQLSPMLSSTGGGARMRLEF